MLRLHQLELRARGRRALAFGDRHLKTRTPRGARLRLVEQQLIEKLILIRAYSSSFKIGSWDLRSPKQTREASTSHLPLQLAALGQRGLDFHVGRIPNAKLVENLEEQWLERGEFAL